MQQRFSIAIQQKTSPARIQQSQLLQMDAEDLQQEVRQWLDHNVMLEADETQDDEAGDELLDMEAATSPAEGPAEVAWDATLSRLARGEDFADEGFEARLAAPEAVDPALQVMEALALEPVAPALRAAALELLEAIDEQGFLERPLALIARACGCDEVLMEQALDLVQRLGPPGYAARSLGEALTLQVQALPESPARALALRLIDHGLSRLGRRDLNALRRALQARPEDFSEALRLLRGLTTRPGAVNDAARPIVPDLRVCRRQGRWEIELTEAAQPRLRINQGYAELLPGLGAEAAPLRQQLGEARGLMKLLHQRNETLLKVAQAVLRRQFAVLQQGLAALRPLSLREIADAVGVHESTVCRAVNGKYVTLPFGVLELRAFFSQATGEDQIAAAAARAMVRQEIEAEPAGAPLDDGLIAERLARRGVRLARRTVTKYREALGYPPARCRALPARA